MKKQLLILAIMISPAFGAILQAQDTIKHLIFTEWWGATQKEAYFELTNVGDSSIDLSNFTVANVPSNNTMQNVDGALKISRPLQQKKRLTGYRLGPGETFLIINVWDAVINNRTQHRTKLIPLADVVNHNTDVYAGNMDTLNQAAELWGARYGKGNPVDSFDVSYQLLRNMGGVGATVLFYHLPDGDSVMVDQVNLYLDGLKTQNTYSPVAGIETGTLTHLLVRKSNVTKGNVDWDAARGVDLEDSEWIPVPIMTGQKLYTTIKNHGNFSIDMSSATVDFDKGAATMTVPWGTYKDIDSIASRFEFGTGMGWFYIEDTLSVEDSAHTIVQTGDILNIYACGDDLEEIDFKITTADPQADIALVFPLRRLRYESLKDPAYIGTVWGPAPYYVTDGDPVIDTVGNVPFATRVDTMFKYLEKAPNANWEIVWVDGKQRVDLKYGDKLKVTAENGSTTKEYFIDVQDYAPSDNALLGAITWPDKKEFLEGWMGDTIPQFSPNQTIYKVLLSYGTTSVPALTAIPQNLRASVSETRAVNLTGSLSERTTIFTATAESDTITNAYSVIFEVEKPMEDIQRFSANPFISEFVMQESNALCFMEIVNPGNLPLDLSEYLFVTSKLLSPFAALMENPPAPTVANHKNRYRAYVPGFRYYEDTTDWLLNPGILLLDQDVNPIVNAGDVFIMASAASGRERYILDPQWEIIRKIWKAPVNIDELGVAINGGTVPHLKFANEAVYLFKILNDSVLEGRKPVGDPLDYELVDVFGDAVADGIWNVAGRAIASRTQCNVRRKPHVYEGVKNIGDGLGSTADGSDWTVKTYPDEIKDFYELSINIGGHSMNEITYYKSTVTSNQYLVSGGYLSPQTIQGVFSSLTVEQFYGLVSKADSGQSLSVLSGTDGSVKGSSDPIAGNDTLLVVSADGNNKTKYALINQPLDSDAALVKANAVSRLTITIDGSVGTIGGVKYGDLLKNLVDSVVVPAKAVMHIISKDGKLLPLRALNADTVYMDTRIGDNVFFEVLAQDGITKITYKLEPAVQSSDAFVISTLYDVNEATKIISKINDGTSVALLLWNIEAVRGATIIIIDKYGFVRSTGIISYDDRLRVVSQDGSNTVIYYLQFLGQPEPAINQAPVVTLAQSDFAIKTDNPTINVSATVTDDGLPLPAAVSYLWEVIEGDASKVSIAAADAMASAVTFSATGSYKLKFTADDGELSDMAEVTVSVTTPTNTAPVVGVSFPSASVVINTALTVTATATDDGFPAPPGALTYKWSVKTGDASKVTIANDSQLETNVTFSALGSYVLEFSANDGEIASKKEIAVTVTVGVGVAGVPEPAVKMYPNPARERVNLELINIGEGTATVRIFNLTGKSVYTIETIETKMEIDISGLDAGVYFVAVSAGENHVIQKLNILR